MDRAALLTYMQGLYGPLQEMAGITVEDSPAGVAGLLDAIARVYERHPGLAPEWAAWLAEYVLLDRINNALLGMPSSMSADGDSYSYADALKAMRDQLAMLRERVGWLIFPEPDAPADGVGQLVTVISPFLSGGAGGGEWG